MVNYFFYIIGQSVALALPLKLAYGLAVFISDLRSLFAFEDRRQVWGNLKAIFPEIPDSRARGIRRQLSRNFAKYLVDFFRFAKIDKEYLQKNVKIEGLGHLDAALKRGKGVVIVSAHIGNWEMGAIVVALLGYPISAVALTHRSKEVNDFFVAQRRMKGVEVIPFENAVRRSLSVLREGRILALVGDRDFTKKGGVTVDFFGRPTMFPKGPAALALKTGAAVVPTFMFRNKGDTFTLKFEEPLEFSPGQEENSGVTRAILAYKTIIEAYVRRFPEQWFMFRRFWV